MVCGALELVFCFDTTGSMSSVLNSVKTKISELSSRLFADIPNIRIGVIAHGDYGDRPYVTKRLDFTTNGQILCDFINNVEATGGADFAECYELAIHEVRTLFNWTANTNKILIMIGDAIPHEMGEKRNIKKLDWRKEVNLAKKDLKLKIYAIQAYENASSTAFWQELATLSDGKHLEFKEIDNVFSILLAICYHEHGVDALDLFENELRTRPNGLALEVGQVFNALRSDSITSMASLLNSTRPPKRTTTTTTTAAAAAADVSVAPTPAKRIKISPKTPIVKSNKSKSLIFRESISNKQFGTKEKHDYTKWSQWTLFCTQRKPLKLIDWIKKKNYFLKKTWTINQRENPWTAAGDSQLFHYELAVQSVENGRRVPVCFTHLKHKNSSECENLENLSNQFIKENDLEKKIEKVINGGMKIFIRRRRLINKVAKTKVTTKLAKKLNEEMIKKYDFAWFSERSLKIGAATISYSSRR